MFTSKRQGFTLIELLIVVAIIAILAAIAVPNFLEAQVRAKVSRAKTDMRSAATALESYRVDFNAYPYDGYNYNGNGRWPAAPPNAGYNYWYLPPDISTPVSYMSTCVLIDPFRQAERKPTDPYQFDNVRYTNIDSTWGTPFDGIQTTAPGTSTQYVNTSKEFGGWRLNSAGPDRTFGPYGWVGISAYPPASLQLPYDPTNGTVSDGDILRTQLSSTGYINAK